MVARRSSGRGGAAVVNTRSGSSIAASILSRMRTGSISWDRERRPAISEGSILLGTSQPTRAAAQSSAAAAAGRVRHFTETGRRKVRSFQSSIRRFAIGTVARRGRTAGRRAGCLLSAQRVAEVEVVQIRLTDPLPLNGNGHRIDAMAGDGRSNPLNFGRHSRVGRKYCKNGPGRNGSYRTVSLFFTTVSGCRGAAERGAAEPAVQEPHANRREGR